jgi:hypothetical protein
VAVCEVHTWEPEVTAIAYVNTNSSQLLGAGEYFIITLRRGSSFLGGPVFDSAYMAGVRNVYEKLPGTGLAFPITRNSASPGAKETAFDVRTAQAGANFTVGQLAAKAQELAGGAVNVVRIRRLEKGKTGQEDRAAARERELVEASKGPEPGLIGLAGRIADVLAGGAKNLALLLVVAVVAYAIVRGRK